MHTAKAVPVTSPGEGAEKMKKNFVGRSDECDAVRVWTVQTCTAIAVTEGDKEPQDALLVYPADEIMGREEYVMIVFGWKMPEDDEGFAAMCEDSGAWSRDWEDLNTVTIEEE